MQDPQQALLDRRLPRDEVVVGRAYVIHARNGGVGVARVRQDGRLGCVLRRTKWEETYLFSEIDWDDDSTFGTAISMRELEGHPPTDDDELLDWLAVQEAEVATEVRAMWREVLGFLPEDFA